MSDIAYLHIVGEIVSAYLEEVKAEGEFTEDGGTLGEADREDAAIRGAEPPEDMIAYVEDVGK